MNKWLPIESAPRDGTIFIGRFRYADRLTGKLRYRKHRTRWGKSSHVPLYGWTYCSRGDVEECTIWEPEDWQPLPPPPTGEEE